MSGMSDIEWRTGTPPKDILLRVKCSDYMGEWETEATRKDYKKPPKGKSKKGCRKKQWRWVDSTGECFGDAVDYWAYKEEAPKTNQERAKEAYQDLIDWQEGENKDG